MFAFLSVISNVIRCASNTVEPMECEEIDELQTDPKIIELEGKLNSFPRWLKNEWFEKTKEEIHEIIFGIRKRIVELEWLANKQLKREKKTPGTQLQLGELIPHSSKLLMRVETLRQEITKYTDFLKYRHHTPKEVLEAQIAEYKQVKMELTFFRQTHEIVRCLFAMD